MQITSAGQIKTAPLRTAQSPPAPTTPGDQVTLGGHVPAAWPTRPQLPKSEVSKLRQVFDNLVNCGGEGRAALLEDNGQAWNARWRMVESAQHSLTSQYFCWDHDVFGMALLGHMYKKVKNDHVKMRLMVDATGDTFGTRGFKSHIGGKDYLQELVNTGDVEARVYHPHWKKLLNQVRQPASTSVIACNHDKILVVDGERGMTGGRNIGYEYFVHPDDFKGAWRDTDAYFESRAAAQSLTEAFDIEFANRQITEGVRPDLLGNWVKRDLELVGAYALMDLWLKDEPMPAGLKAELRSVEESRTDVAADLVQRALKRLPAEGIDREPNKRELKKLNKLAQELVKFPELRGSYHQTPPELHDAEVKILDKTSSVGMGRDEINTTLLQMARTAEKRIVIENPYVVLTDSLIEGLKEAGERGVEIWLGTNSPSSTDSDVTQAFFLADWPKLEATIPNLKIFVATGERKLHAKVAVIDDVCSLVSTFNLDFISQQCNSEVASVIWSEDFARETTQGIYRDHADERNGAVEYTIKRDEEGRPIRSDGLPVLGEDGKLVNDPEVTFGPDNHLDPQMLEDYKGKKFKWNLLRKVIPHLAPLETFQ